MSFLTNLFGGGKAPAPPPAAPLPIPAAPTIASGVVETADRELQDRLRKRKGLDQSILVGLGTSKAPDKSSDVSRTTLLGGGTAY